MSFEIENEHAIPAARQHNGRREKYPWSQMDVGQSFFVENGEVRKIAGAACHAGRRANKKFVVRVAEGGVRAWRYE
jgi:hypothetical protein